MKKIREVKDVELEKVIGGSLVGMKIIGLKQMGPDGMTGSGGTGAPIGHTYYHPAHQADKAINSFQLDSKRYRISQKYD